MDIRRCCPLILLAATVLAALPARAGDDLTIKTEKGKIHGKLSGDGQIRDFLGVPFAAPPVGALRWQPPQPDAKWHGTREATSFGARCMQSQLFPDMRFRDPGPSEDCLTLNVWTPVAAKHAKLPVMVWIYGGGYVTGGTSEPRQDGEHLAHKGVIVVSMNYRLGIFGFFAGSGLAAESPVHAAGNYGLLDETAAIQWVHRNIGRFGGDPEKVTIFGESAGSFSVSSQMASPLAQGLFVRAIGESGGAFASRSLPSFSLADRERLDDSFAQQAFGTSDIGKLRALSADELLRAQSTSTGIHFSPDVDGYFLPESVPAIYAAGKQAHIPLLAGWNKDEGTGIVVNAPEPPTVESFREQAEKEFGDRADEFLKAYAASNDAEALRVAEDFAGDRFIAFSTWAWLEAQGKTGGKPVYRYRFDLGSPGDPYHPVNVGAFHSDDIEYVFGNLDSRQGATFRPEDYKLSELMQTYWTNFAKTGDPNGTDTPRWPAYDAVDEWQVMHLDADPQARPDQHRDRYLFLQKVWSAPSGEQPAATRP